jgi:hypothetical protein
MSGSVRNCLLELLVFCVVAGGAIQGETEPTGKQWLDMNYGPYLTHTVEGPRDNFAYKGLVIRVGGNLENAVSTPDCASMVFDTDLLRWSAAWTGGFLNMSSIVWDGSHGTHPSVRGDLTFHTAMVPGWAPASLRRRFRDPRELPYGPIPREMAHYKGLYLHGNQAIVSYSVGAGSVLEHAALEEGLGLRAFVRTVRVEGLAEAYELQVAARERREVYFLDGETLEMVSGGEGASEGDEDRQDSAQGARAVPLAVLGTGSDVPVPVMKLGRSVLAVGLVDAPQGAEWRKSRDALRLFLPETKAPVQFQLVFWSGPPRDLPSFATLVRRVEKGVRTNLVSLTHGGPARWSRKLVSAGKLGAETEAYTVDTLATPLDNPWNSWMRLGGIEFFDDDSRLVAGTWNGDVWIVSGIDESLETLSWHRIATGLFQPLGIKIVDDKIYVLGRDQITILHDLNADGETDFYENFNNDAEVTEHFHEFAMDLQTDADGNFYYCKGGRHAKDSVVPQHGTLLKVSKNGSRTEFIAYGYRAPNGLCVNDDGTFISSDQEGHWTPSNRINWIKPGGFYGYMWAYHRGEVPTEYDKPLCWIHKEFDRSPSEQLWVRSDRWGPLENQLISLSYGTGNMQVVNYEDVGGLKQGGVAPLPVKMFPTGICRGRFRPTDGQLYLCGLFGWAGNRTQAGGLYRVRYTGKAVHVPVGIRATRSGVLLTFSAPLDPSSAREGRFNVERWNYKWQERYGSDDFRLSDGKVGRDRVPLEGVRLSADGRSIFLAIEDMKPCMQMRIRYRLTGRNGARVASEIYNTIHVLGDDTPVRELFGD